MNSVTVTSGGFQKVIFESVIDTLAGGASLDVTGFTNANGIIPAGTMVGAKNATTGLHAIVTSTAGTLSATPIGFVHADVALVSAGNNLVGVVIEGTVRRAALPGTVVDADVASMKTAMPKISIV